MKKGFLLLAGAVVAALMVLAVVISRQPDTFVVERAAFIAAPPEAIFPHVNTLRRWEAWSPWARLDAGMKDTFSGPEPGAGAVLAWEGNHEVGTGRMTVTESRPHEFIRIRLDFEKPMAGTAECAFRFEPENGGTRVTWSMTGTNSFAGKAVGLVMDCEEMIGGLYAQGLANLRAVAEAPAH